jgi:hypothetical protein
MDRHGKLRHPRLLAVVETQKMITHPEKILFP